MRVAGFLGGGGDGVEADVGEEDEACAAHDAAPAEFAEGAGVGGDEGGVVGWVDVGPAEADDGEDDDDLEDDHDGVEDGAFFGALDEEGGHGEDDECGGQVHDARVFIERGGGEGVGEVEADLVTELHEVGGPCGGDGGCADGVLEDEVPADDPCEEFAEGDVAVGVGAAGGWDHGGEFRVAEAGEGAGEAADDVGEGDGWSGAFSGDLAGEGEEAGSDDDADAEEDEVDGAELAFEGDGRSAGVGVDFCEHVGERFFGEQLIHDEMVGRQGMSQWAYLNWR